MVDRARTSTSSIAGQTPESLLTKSIFANRAITNEQIMGMSRMTKEQVATTDEGRRRTEQAIPDSRNHPNHKFTVDLLHAVTGIPRETLSRNGPDLGMVGSPTANVPGSTVPGHPLYRPGGQPFLWKPTNDREALSTALHDFTDTVKEAGERGAKGVEGVQKAMWGSESGTWSALRSWVNGVPKKHLR